MDLANFPLWPPGSWETLMLFVIPVGGGIPAGVLLARSHGIGWPMMLVLYFVSDVLLALVFEPLLRLMILGGRRFAFLSGVANFLRRMMRQTTALYGTAGGPLALIMIAFGVDPMTGRAAAAAAGHGFVSGWTLAITGDMMYFAVLMVSTLWLNSILGDGRWTMAAMLVLMFVLPVVVRRARERFKS